jgi:hypothetical protein
VKWFYTTTSRRFHYASYALAISDRILNDPRFLAFWKNLPLSQNKKQTVKRGEIGLTQWVLKNGYTHGATLDIHNLDVELSYLEDYELDKVARNLIFPDTRKLDRQKATALASKPNSEEGRQKRIQVILASVARYAPAYALTFFAIYYKGFQFVKKSPLWLSKDGADTLSDVLADLKGPMGRQAFKEAGNLCKRL